MVVPGMGRRRGCKVLAMVDVSSMVVSTVGGRWPARRGVLLAVAETAVRGTWTVTDESPAGFSFYELFVLARASFAGTRRELRRTSRSAPKPRQEAGAAHRLAGEGRPACAASLRPAMGWASVVENPRSRWTRRAGHAEKREPLGGGNTTKAGRGPVKRSPRPDPAALGPAASRSRRRCRQLLLRARADRSACSTPPREDRWLRRRGALDFLRVPVLDLS